MCEPCPSSWLPFAVSAEPRSENIITEASYSEQAALYTAAAAAVQALTIGWPDGVLHTDILLKYAFCMPSGLDTYHVYMHIMTKEPERITL